MHAIHYRYADIGGQQLFYREAGPADAPAVVLLDGFTPPLNVGHGPGIRAVQAEALFVSGLQRCAESTAGQVRQAVAGAIRALGCSGCAGRVAQEFGDRPETAVIRMRWARSVVREAFADSAPESGPRAGAGPWPIVRPRLPASRNGIRDAVRDAAAAG